MYNIIIQVTLLFKNSLNLFSPLPPSYEAASEPMINLMIRFHPQLLAPTKSQSGVPYLPKGDPFRNQAEKRCKYTSFHCDAYSYDLGTFLLRLI